MTAAPSQRTKSVRNSWSVWERLAAGRPGFGRPAVFNRGIAQSYWESFTVTLLDTALFDQMIEFSGNQPEDVQVFWGCALFPDRIGDYVAKPMADCNGEEILRELCGYLRFNPEAVARANCIPRWMPYLTSMFMPRGRGIPVFQPVCGSSSRWNTLCRRRRWRTIN